MAVDREKKSENASERERGGEKEWTLRIPHSRRMFPTVTRGSCPRKMPQTGGVQYCELRERNAIKYVPADGSRGH